VLDAAAEVFAERGCEASVDEIARRAGVGHATVFRRFPTKNHLIAAVVERQLATLVERAEEARSQEDAGLALTDFIWHIAEFHEQNRGLHDCLLRCQEPPEAVALHDTVTKLVQRAQAEGALRTDVTPGDVEALVQAAVKSSPRDRWRQHLTVVLDGLTAKPS
jgi:AcrR family transcriptional regulator